MAHRVAWSPRALADLEAIAEYIATDSAAYAKGVVRRITDQTRSLSRVPHVSPVLGNVGESDKLNGLAPRLGLQPSLGLTILRAKEV